MRTAESYISFSISLSKARSHQICTDVFLFSIGKRYCTALPISCATFFEGRCGPVKRWTYYLHSQWKKGIQMNLRWLETLGPCALLKELHVSSSGEQLSILCYLKTGMMDQLLCNQLPLPNSIQVVFYFWHSIFEENLTCVLATLLSVWVAIDSIPSILQIQALLQPHFFNFDYRLLWQLTARDEVA